MKKQGFSLVELFFSVAAIAILCSMLFPPLNGARMAYRRHTCMNNLKQIAKACLMYADDNDDYFPIGYHMGVGPNGIPNAPANDGTPMYSCLAQGILPYVRNDVYFFHCPQDPGLPNNYSYPTADPWYYGAGATMGWMSFDETSGSLDYIAKPKKTILLLCGPFNPEAEMPDRAALVDWSWLPGDEFGNPLNPGEFWPGNVFDPYYDGFDQSGGSHVTASPINFDPTGAPNAMLQVHKGGTNYAYCDGHVKWHRLNETLYPYNQWTRDGSD
jgi:prepilin-type processing-associated H-X9-DG protein